MNASNANPSHKDLLVQAKRQQRQDLNESAILSEQISRNMSAIVRMNSISNVPGCPPVLDKVDTVHELDREIDRQLEKDIAGNYDRLIKAERKTAKSINKCRRGLVMKNDQNQNYVDVLQRQVEKMDQDIRILENTLALVRMRYNTTH